jgi:hypothetical protein
MTEAEWLASQNADRMWEHMKAAHNAARLKSGKRKLRLWAAACARWHDRISERRNASHPKLPIRREAVDVVERFADGLATRADLERVRCFETSWLVSTSVEWVLASTRVAYVMPGDPTTQEAERMRADTFREVFGNPFRPVALGPAARTPAVVSLARAAYDERLLPSGELDPQRLAVLADALEEAAAGEEALAHLRGPGPHVRGCPVVDAVLRLA